MVEKVDGALLSGIVGDGDDVDGADVAELVAGLAELLGDIRDVVGVFKDEAVGAVTGACWIVVMIDRAAGAGAAKVSLVATPQLAPVVVLPLQQAHSPLVVLYVISGKSSVAARINVTMVSKHALRPDLLQWNVSWPIELWNVWSVDACR